MSSGNNVELRNAIAREFMDYEGSQTIWEDHLVYADRILALPEIAEALNELRVKQRIEAHFAGTRDERYGYRIPTKFEE